ncbi:MAG: 50S ribosomal protein L29 [Vicingaceae bacterium]|nr:MAG: 50S ribosomal protein L29 [Vicingaceae bacterium]
MKLKNTDIRGMSSRELLDRLEELKANLIKLKINNAIATIDNPLQIREIRRTIARIKTELRKRELENK